MDGAEINRLVEQKYAEAVAKGFENDPAQELADELKAAQINNNGWKTIAIALLDLAEREHKIDT